MMAARQAVGLPIDPTRRSRSRGGRRPIFRVPVPLLSDPDSDALTSRITVKMRSYFLSSAFNCSSIFLSFSVGIRASLR